MNSIAQQYYCHRTMQCYSYGTVGRYACNRVGKLYYLIGKLSEQENNVTQTVADGRQDAESVSW